MVYTATPLGMRNITTDQERMNHQAKQAGWDRAMQSQVAQLQADTQRDIQGSYGQRSTDMARESRLGRQHELTRFGDFGQNAAQQRDMAQLDPRHIAANLAERKYTDTRTDDAPLRDLRNQAIGGLDLQQMDPMAGLALAGGNLGQYFQHVGQQQAFDRQSQDAAEAKRLALAQVLMQSESPAAREMGFGIFGGTSGAELPQDVISEMANPMAPNERFAASEVGARAAKEFGGHSFLDGLGDISKGSAATFMTAGLGSPYGVPKIIGGAGEMLRATTDAMNMTGNDAEGASDFVQQMTAETGGDPRMMKMQLEAVIEQIGDQINEEWAEPIRRAAIAFGAMNG